MPPILADLFGEIESELSGGKSAKVPEVGDPFPCHAWVKGMPDSLRHKLHFGISLGGSLDGG